MAGFTQETKVQAAFKKLAGRAITKAKTDEGFKNEALPSNITVAGGTVFAEDLPSLPTRITSLQEGVASPGDITGTVELVRLVLEEIPGTDYDSGLTGDSSGPHGYKARLPNNYESESSNLKAGSGVFLNSNFLVSTEGRLQSVPPIFGVDGLGVADANIYGAKLFDTAGNEILGNDPREWYFDYYNGILFQERSTGDALGNPLPTPGSIEVLLYIGDYVTDVIGTGSGGGPDSDWIDLGVQTWPGSAGATGTFLVTTSSLAINPYGGTAFRSFDAGQDTSFYVHGVPGSRSEWLAGVPFNPGTVAQFGGDLVASGSIVAGNLNLGGGPVGWSPGDNTPAIAHIFTGTNIDIGRFDPSGGPLNTEFASIRQIGDTSNRLTFISTNTSLFTGQDEYHGVQLAAADGPKPGVNRFAGSIFLNAGNHNDPASPDFSQPSSNSNGYFRGGDVNVVSGDGTWVSGDIKLHAGGSSGIQPINETEGGPHGGNIEIYAGTGMFSGNISIAGGNNTVRMNDITAGHQQNTGDVYIDGGNDEISNEGLHVGNVLINTVANTGEPDLFSYNKETWLNLYHPTKDITSILTSTPSETPELIASEEMIHILAQFLGVFGLRKITCKDYQQFISPVSPPYSWQGPFYVTYSYGGPGSIGLGPTMFNIKWGFDNSLGQFAIEIVINDKDVNTGTNTNTLQDLADALNDPNSWIDIDTGVAWLLSPSNPLNPNPVRLKFNSADGTIVLTTPSAPLPLGDMICAGPAEGYKLDNSTKKGLGVGEPLPTATLHVTDNGRANEWRRADGGIGVLGTPMAIDGLNEFNGLGSILVAVPDPYDAEWPVSKTDLVYKLPLQSFASLALSSTDGSGNELQRTQRLTTVNSEMVGPGAKQGEYFVDGKYYVDSYDGGPDNRAAATNSALGTPSTPIWFDDTILIDTNDPAIVSQAVVNGNKIEVHLPSAIYSTYMDKNGNVSSTPPENPGASGAGDYYVELKPAGRVIEIKDVGGVAGEFNIDIIPAIDQATGNYEKIDQFGGDSGAIPSINSGYSSLKLISNGRGWSIIGS